WSSISTEPTPTQGSPLRRNSLNIRIPSCGHARAAPPARRPAAQRGSTTVRAQVALLLRKEVAVLAELHREAPPPSGLKPHDALQLRKEAAVLAELHREAPPPSGHDEKTRT
ncbi:hypothetical protein FRX31_032685, partial [Thalictrum thalictroides]